MDKFVGKTYLIVGASSGIGKSVAELLTKEKKANVVLIARRESIIKQLAEELPGNNFYFTYDLENIEKIGTIFEFCKKENIKLDGMVYTAGIAPLCTLAENNLVEMMQTMNINAFSFAEIGKYLLTADVVNEKASIVAVSSNVSMAVTNRQSAYAASKTMLNTYAKFMAKEALGKMRVNVVVPAAVDTEMFDELRKNSENLDERIKRSQPLGVIPVDRVSKLIAYLLSDDADYITGSLFTIDAGFSLR